MLFRKRQNYVVNSEDIKRMKEPSNVLEAVEDLQESIEEHARKLTTFIDLVKDEYRQQMAQLKIELDDLKEELKKKNAFLEQLVLQLIDKGAANKPLSATEAYLAKKAADGSKPIPLPK